MAPYRIDYQEALNPAQLEAVMFQQGPLLVIAGAGSGKTRTLTYRVARLVEDGIPPRSILLLTFTRKASSEMLYRATQLLDSRCEGVSGGTFHSFAYRILRRYSTRIDFPNGFTVIDRSDAESLIGMIRSDLSAKTTLKAFPKKQTIMNIFSKAANKTESIEDIIYDDYPHFFNHQETLLSLLNTYTLRKRQHGLMDYDDLLTFLHQLLNDQPDVNDQISSAYQYILVDEYQDTNRLQAEILYLLTNRNRNVMAVGDDSQSIYAFRGANFRNIMDFPKLYPGTKIIGLEENYRSVQPILSLTNAIIDRSAEKYDKHLFTRKTGGTKPLLINTGDEHSQSRYIANKIEELHRIGLKLNDIAVLFRASFHSFDLEIELSHQHYPFVKVGGFKFVESAHIKDILAHMKVIANPSDRISWYRLLLLIDAIGPKTADGIFEKITRQKAGYRSILGIQLKSKKEIGLQRVKELFAGIDSHSMTVSQLGEAIIHYYEPILKDKFDDYPKRAKDLDHILTIMDRYRNLEEFLTDMALEPPNTSDGKGLSDQNSPEDRLVLSTIHSAKGLEWHTVFVIWALDGRFPSIQSMNSPEDLEEELRLMYVAATRAKENLIFTYPGQSYDRATGMLLGSPSRFIDRIPVGTLQKESLLEW